MKTTHALLMGGCLLALTGATPALAQMAPSPAESTHGLPPHDGGRATARDGDHGGMMRQQGAADRAGHMDDRGGMGGRDGDRHDGDRHDGDRHDGDRHDGDMRGDHGRDRDGGYDDRGDRGRHHGWHERRNCRIVWHHHHRVRRCW